MAERKPFAVVTGASAGIGRAFAQALAAEGYDLLLVARRKALLDELAGELEKSGSVAAHICVEDLAAEGAPARVAAQAREIGHCDLLVNNAGAGLIGTFAESDPARIRAMLSLNVVATTELMQLFLKVMIGRQSGVILNVASTAGFQPVPRFAAYAASKAYVLSLTEALADEVRGTGVRVAAVCPGATETEFTAVAGGRTDRLKAAYMSPQDVVRIAIEQAVLGQQTVVVPGAVNRASVLGSKLLPRQAAARIAGWIYRYVESKEDKGQ
jgi:uncharacterized protein